MNLPDFSKMDDFQFLDWASSEIENPKGKPWLFTAMASGLKAHNPNLTHDERQEVVKKWAETG